MPGIDERNNRRRLAQALARHHWMDDWPPALARTAIAERASPDDLATWPTPPTALSPRQADVFIAAAALRAATSEAPDPPTATMDQVRAWMQAAQAMDPAAGADKSRWPPTPVSFGRAIALALADTNGQMLPALAIVSAYPQTCAAAVACCLKANAGWTPPPPAAVATQWLAACRGLDWPYAIDSPAPPDSSGYRQAASPSSPPPTGGRNQAYRQAEENVGACVERLHAMASTVRSMEADAQAPWEWLDGAIKAWLTQAAPSFAREIWPALSRLPRQDMESLVRHWPNHATFVVDDPVRLFTGKSFWFNAARAATNRNYLFHKMLPRLMAHDQWSAATRRDLLEVLVDRPAVLASKEELDARLRLWQGLGGNLDEPAAASASADAFSSPSAPATTPRQWLQGLTASPPRQSLRGPA